MGSRHIDEANITGMHLLCLDFIKVKSAKIRYVTLLHFQHGISPRELNCVSTLPNVPSGMLFGGEDGTLYVCKFNG